MIKHSQVVYDFVKFSISSRSKCDMSAADGEKKMRRGKALWPEYLRQIPPLEVAFGESKSKHYASKYMLRRSFLSSPHHLTPIKPLSLTPFTAHLNLELFIIIFSVLAQVSPLCSLLWVPRPLTDLTMTHLKMSVFKVRS